MSRLKSSFPTLSHLGLRFLPILIAQILLLVFMPMPLGRLGSWFVTILYYGSILAAIGASKAHKNLIAVTSVLTLYCFLSDAFGLFDFSSALISITLGFNAFLLLATPIAILVFVMRSERITADAIIAALCVYFFAGIFFEFLYIQVEKFIPGSFLISQSTEAAIRNLDGTVEPMTRLSNFLYYSFITLTTLGYGDIVPVKPLSRALTILEALFGQVYLAVLVARLVSLNIVHSSDKKPNS